MNLALSCLLFLATVLQPASNMTFTTHLDRTAVWAGDQFHYLITIDYPADYEFVLDNLTKETINMDPFQVIDVRKSAVAQKDSHWKLFVELTLANFTTGQTSLQIPQFTLYYFRKANRTTAADQADAESLTVPGPSIGIRSTLPSQPEDIRDAVAMTSWDRHRWVFPVLGWICSAALALLLGREATLFVKSLKAQKGPDRRKAMEGARLRWLGSVPSDFTNAAACLNFCSHSYHTLKEYIGYYLDVPTSGLTAEEIREEMQRLGAEPDFMQKVSRVLEVCEKFQYAPPAQPADTEIARSIADNMREIFKPRELTKR
jgi:hypothetical protein